MNQPIDMHCPVCGSMLSAVTFTCILGDKCKPVKWLKLADSLSASEAQAFMNKVKREDAKLRKLGGLGNNSRVEVRFDREYLDKRTYAVWVVRTYTLS